MFDSDFTMNSNFCLPKHNIKHTILILNYLQK